MFICIYMPNGLIACVWFYCCVVSYIANLLKCRLLLELISYPKQCTLKIEQFDCSCGRLFCSSVIKFHNNELLLLQIFLFSFFVASKPSWWKNNAQVIYEYFDVVGIRLGKKGLGVSFLATSEILLSRWLSMMLQVSERLPNLFPEFCLCSCNCVIKE